MDGTSSSPLQLADSVANSNETEKVPKHCVCQIAHPKTFSHLVFAIILRNDTPKKIDRKVMDYVDNLVKKCSEYGQNVIFYETKKWSLPQKKQSFIEEAFKTIEVAPKSPIPEHKQLVVVVSNFCFAPLKRTMDAEKERTGIPVLKVMVQELLRKSPFGKYEDLISIALKMNVECSSKAELASPIPHDPFDNWGFLQPFVMGVDIRKGIDKSNKQPFYALGLSCNSPQDLYTFHGTSQIIPAQLPVEAHIFESFVAEHFAKFMAQGILPKLILIFRGGVINEDLHEAAKEHDDIMAEIIRQGRRIDEGYNTGVWALSAEQGTEYSSKYAFQTINVHDHRTQRDQQFFILKPHDRSKYISKMWMSKLVQGICNLPQRPTDSFRTPVPLMIANEQAIQAVQNLEAQQDN